MKTIENSTQAKITATGKTKRSGDEVLQELWSIKAQLNREANFDLATLAERANATAIRLGFSAVCGNTRSAGSAFPKLNLSPQPLATPYTP